MRGFSLLTSVIALLALSTGSASAEDRWYAGISVGGMDVGIICTVNCDDKDTGVRLFGGYEFAEYWGAEFGYMDLGEATSGTAVVEIDGFDILVTGTYPLNDQFDVFAKVGAYFLNADLSDPLGVSQDTDSSGFTFAFGGSFNINDNFSVRAEWQLFDDIGEQTITGSSDLEFLSIGLVYAF